MHGPPTRLIGWALEGLPFAGKSSTARSLNESRSQTVVVPDYHELVAAEERHAFGQIPLSAIDQRNRIETYLELERTRWRRVMDASGSQVVLDRCHLSLMAYAIAFEPTIGAAATEQSLSRINASLRDPTHPLQLPAGIVYIEMGALTASKRCARHATTMHPSLRTVEFARRLIAAYERVLSEIQTEVVRCSSEQPLDALHAEVASVLRSRLAR